MTLKITIFLSPGEKIETSIPEQVKFQARTLVYAPSRYFLIDIDTVMLPLTNLVFTRMREQGVQRAVELMSLAYNGEHSLREPVSVRRWRDGLYVLIDGNSTAVIGTAAGWPDIPAKVVSDFLPHQAD